MKVYWGLLVFWGLVAWLLYGFIRRHRGPRGPVLVPADGFTKRDVQELLALRAQALGIVAQAKSGRHVRQQVRQIERKRRKIMARAKRRAA